jgi:hypothetical protein
VARGVVVTQTRGFEPSRKSSMSMSKAPGYRQQPTSSHQTASCWGPRSRSGSSAVNVVATTPLGQVSLRLLGLYRGRNHGGLTDRSPDSPSTMTSRTSAAVGPTRAIRRACLVSARLRIHSAPVRVLPQARPAGASQVRQSPAGGHIRPLSA